MADRQRQGQKPFEICGRPTAPRPETIEINGGPTTSGPETIEIYGRPTAPKPETIENNDGPTTPEPETIEINGGPTMPGPETNENNGGPTTPGPGSTGPIKHRTRTVRNDKDRRSPGQRPLQTLADRQRLGQSSPGSDWRPTMSTTKIDEVQARNPYEHGQTNSALHGRQVWPTTPMPKITAT